MWEVVVGALLIVAAQTPAAAKEPGSVPGVCLMQNKVTMQSRSTTADHSISLLKSAQRTFLASSHEQQQKMIEARNAAVASALATAARSTDPGDSASALADSMKVLDTNFDGTVDKQEVMAFANEQGIALSSMEQEFSALDANGDGQLQVSEISQTMDSVVGNETANANAAANNANAAAGNNADNATAAPEEESGGFMSSMFGNNDNDAETTEAPTEAPATNNANAAETNNVAENNAGNNAAENNNAVENNVANNAAANAGNNAAETNNAVENNAAETNNAVENNAANNNAANANAAENNVVNNAAETNNAVENNAANNNAAENNAGGTNNAVAAATEEIAEAEKDEVVTAEASPQNMTAAHVKELKQARELSKTVALALQHKVEAEGEAMKLEALAADLRANETALMNRASFAAQSAAMKAARIAAKAILKMHLIEEAKAE